MSVLYNYGLKQTGDNLYAFAVYFLRNPLLLVCSVITMICAPAFGCRCNDRCAVVADSSGKSATC